jgi:hypothetical protein
MAGFTPLGGTPKTDIVASYQVTLQPKPDPSDPGGERRLRWALKFLLRRFGLRCIAVRKQESEGKEVGSSRRMPPALGTANSREAQLPSPPGG